MTDVSARQGLALLQCQGARGEMRKGSLLGPGERRRYPATLSPSRNPALRLPADPPSRTYAHARSLPAAKGAAISPGKPAHAQESRLDGLQRLRSQRTRGLTGHGVATSPTCYHPAPAASQEEDKANKQSRRHQVHHRGHHDNGFQMEPASASSLRPGIAQTLPNAHVAPPVSHSRLRPPLGPAQAAHLI